MPGEPFVSNVRYVNAKAAVVLLALAGQGVRSMRVVLSMRGVVRCVGSKLAIAPGRVWSQLVSLHRDQVSNRGVARRTDAPFRRRGHLGLAAVLAFGVVSLVSGRAALAASLKAEYRFNGTRASSVAGAPSAADVSTARPNTFATETVRGAAAGVLRFPQGNGLQVSTAGVIPTSTYTIVVVFRFSEVSGYERIIDFKNGTTVPTALSLLAPGEVGGGPANGFPGFLV